VCMPFCVYFPSMCVCLSVDIVLVCIDDFRGEILLMGEI
jgi:hypothetical protein